MKTIAIQGVAGSFHDEAAKQLVGDAESVACTTFQEVFAMVQKGETDYGVVAIENSIHGSINPVYRLLERNNLWIAGETTLNIEQYLIGTEDVSLEELNSEEAEVRTMFPAFAQCELWLEENLPAAKRVEIFDTAYSLVSILEEPARTRVAIAGKYAHKVYGGKIIAGPINDDIHNYTRFILLTKDKVTAEDANRTQLVLTTSHTEGALFEALGVFAKAGINLSKLDSHPIPADKRHYAFYVDLDASLESEAVTESLIQLKEQGCTVKVLGSYKVS